MKQRRLACQFRLFPFCGLGQLLDRKEKHQLRQSALWIGQNVLVWRMIVGVLLLLRRLLTVPLTIPKDSSSVITYREGREHKID